MICGVGWKGPDFPRESGIGEILPDSMSKIAKF